MDAAETAKSLASMTVLVRRTNSFMVSADRRSRRPAVAEATTQSSAVSQLYVMLQLKMKPWAQHHLEIFRLPSYSSSFIFIIFIQANETICVLLLMRLKQYLKFPSGNCSITGKPTESKTRSSAVAKRPLLVTEYFDKSLKVTEGTSK